MTQAVRALLPPGVFAHADIARKATNFLAVLALFTVLGLASMPIVFVVPERAVPGVLVMFLGSFTAYGLGAALSLRGHVGKAGFLTGSLVSLVMVGTMWRSGMVSDLVWFLVIGLLLSSFASSPWAVIGVFVVDLLLLGAFEATEPSLLRPSTIALVPSVLSLLTTVAGAGALYASIDNRSFRALLEERRRVEEARRDAEEASKAKSVFLATMSHELRTPLNAIIGYAELLREEWDDQPDEEDIQHIESSGRRLLGIVNDLLELANLEAGRQELCIESIDIAVLLRDVVASTDPRSNELLVDAPSIVLSTDILRLEYALRLLLNNAVKFTEGGRVTLSARQLGDRLRITVSDTGIGMDPHTLDRVFEAFVQADGSATRQHGGTGIGLALARRLVALLGGRITAESTLGEGSSFTVCVPMDPAGRC